MPTDDTRPTSADRQPPGGAPDPQLVTLLIRLHGLRAELDRLDDAITLMGDADRPPLAAWCNSLRDAVDGLGEDIESLAAGR